MSFFDSDKKEVSLLVDIGNGSITSSFVMFGEGKPPSFLYTTKSTFPVSDKPDAIKLLQSMENVLDETLESLIKNGWGGQDWGGSAKKIAHVMVTFSSPWFMSKTKHLIISKETEFTITEDFINDVVEKESETFKKELAKNLLDPEKDSFEVIEKSIVHTKVNGYKLKESIGKKTKTLDAFLSISIVPESVVSKVYNTILKYTHIPREKIITQTFPLVSFSVIRDLFTDALDFIIMDVTGEVTDLTLVRDDVIIGTASLPSGRNFIIREIMKTFDIPHEVAESTLHIYVDKKLNDEMVKNMENLLISIEKEWSIYLENVLLELSPEMVLPSRVYITADRDVAMLYMEFLKLAKTDVTADFRKNINIIHINDETLKPLYQNDSKTKVDEFVAILSIFYNKVSKNQ